MHTYGFASHISARAAIHVSETEALFSVLRQSADAGLRGGHRAHGRATRRTAICAASMYWISPAKHGLDEERAIAAFLHAARLGLFELSWNVLCPGCGGVLDASSTLKTVNRDEYDCMLCACGYKPTLDEMVEVTFTVSPRVRRIAAHDPETLPEVEYYRQIFWSSGVDLPETLGDMLAEFTVDSIDLPPGDKAVLSVQLPERIRHRVRSGDARHAISSTSKASRRASGRRCPWSSTGARRRSARVEMRPGPLRLSLENRTDRRVLPALWIAGDSLHHLLGKRKPFLTAKRLLTNQTFRDIYRHRYARRRSAAQDHEPYFPVHRPQRLDRALRASRRPRRPTIWCASIFACSRDRGGRGRRGGQDHRRCGDGDILDARPGAHGGAAHARGNGRINAERKTRICCSRSAFTRGRASR